MNFAVFSQLMAIRARQQQSDVLPDAYTAVDYIICTGKQYIDTGLVASSNGKYLITAKKAADKQNKAVMGDGKAKETATMALWLNDNTGTDYSSQAIFGDGGSDRYKATEAKVTPLPAALSARTYVIDLPSKSYYINDTLVATAASSQNFLDAVKLVIGGSWRGSSVNSYFTGDIYEFKVWEGSTKLRDMVPCIKKEGNVPGMYDFVTKTFFSSATSTPFGAPTVITIVQSTVNVGGSAGVALTALDLADSAYTTISPSGTRSFSASVLPTGVSLTTAGVLSGTPSWGFHRESIVTVSASGAESKTLTLVFSIATTEQQVTMTVSENPISISGTVGTPLSIDLSDYVTTSNATYMGFVPNSDPLPPGLTLNLSGIISGTPTTAGSTTYTINFIASGNTVEEGVENAVSELVTIQFSITDGGGADAEAVQRASIVYGDGVSSRITGDTEEELRHSALINNDEE